MRVDRLSDSPKHRYDGDCNENVQRLNPDEAGQRFGIDGYLEHGYEAYAGEEGALRNAESAVA